MDKTRKWAIGFAGGVAVAIALLACSGNSQTNVGSSATSFADASTVVGDDASSDEIFPATHPATPRISKGSSTGTILVSPHILPIAFSGDPLLTTIGDFTSAVGSSAYWHTAVGEYGVGPATAAAPIVIDPSELGLGDAGAITFSSDDTKNFLAAHLDGAHAGWGLPDANTIYVLFFPAGVTTDDDFHGNVSCTDFGGYHAATTVNGTNIAYVVIPRCDHAVGRDDVTGGDAITSALSHELAEASTDPFDTLHDVGYAKLDPDHAAWSIVPGGELADMCSMGSDALLKPSALGFLVARVWSDAAASAGAPPCQPIDPNVVDYGAAPVLTDDVTIVSGYYGANGPTKGVHAPLGVPVTIEIDLYSNAPMSAPLQVQAFDIGDTEPELDIVLDHDVGVNGDKIHATITRVKNGAYGGSEMIFSAYTSDSDFRDWVGFASN